MTVLELIEALKQFDPNAMVVVRGYEGGFSDPEPPRLQMIDVGEPGDAGDQGVYGRHGPTYDDREHGPQAVQAVLIDRE